MGDHSSWFELVDGPPCVLNSIPTAQHYLYMNYEPNRYQLIVRTVLKMFPRKGCQLILTHFMNGEVRHKIYPIFVQHVTQVKLK